MDDAGGIDQGVQAPEARPAGGYGLLDGCRRGDIEHQGEHAVAVQFIGGRPQFFAVDIGDGDPGALGEQGLGGAQAEAAGPAGDQRASRIQSGTSRRSLR